MIKVYQKYLISKFISKFILISFVFLSLIFILGLLEEISFLGNSKKNSFLPYLLTALNAPITLFEIFPFIFLLTTQYLFYELFKNDELDLFKKNGLSNLKIIKIILILSFIIGIFNILIYYNFASTLKSTYSGIKNNLSNDNKYLAMVNDNGLWIKENIDDHIYIIKAENINENYLQEIVLYKFDKKFNLISIIQSNKIDISSTNWLIYEPYITENNVSKKNLTHLNFKSNFNTKIINSLFSNNSTQNLIQLFKVKNNYQNLGYDTKDISIHILKVFSMPLNYSFLTIFAAVIMFNMNNRKSLITHLMIGVSISVVIYYFNYIFNILGTKGKIPISLSVFFPMLILFLISIISLVRVNEK